MTSATYNFLACLSTWETLRLESKISGILYISSFLDIIEIHK